MLVVRRLLFDICCFSFVVGLLCLLVFDVWSLLLVVYYVLFVVCYLLFLLVVCGCWL